MVRVRVFLPPATQRHCSISLLSDQTLRDYAKNVRGAQMHHPLYKLLRADGEKATTVVSQKTPRLVHVGKYVTSETCWPGSF
jgi:hypothetical protein